jgi:sarcosine oxidase/L-pipecolate oxidase
MYDQVTATGQQVIQFKPPKNYVDAYSNDPVWCADLSVTGHYGFPSTPGGNLLKVGKHSSGYVHSIYKVIKYRSTSLLFFSRKTDMRN